MSNLETNKANVRAYYETAFGGQLNWPSSVTSGPSTFNPIRKRAMVQQPSFSSYIVCAASPPSCD